MGTVFELHDPYVTLDGKDVTHLFSTIGPLIFLPTNREIFADADRPLCEWEPDAGRPALLSDPFHAFATLRVGSRDCFTFRVCEDCARSRSLARRELPVVPLNGGY